MTTNSQPSILIADDQPDVLEALRLLLKGEGFRIKTVTSPAGIIAALEQGSFDGLLMDLNYTRDTTSGREGLDLLPQLRDLDSTLLTRERTGWRRSATDRESGAIVRPAQSRRPCKTLRLSSLRSTPLPRLPPELRRFRRRGV